MANRKPMRSLLVILFLFAACGIAHAQQQERKLLDRLDKPDLNESFFAEKKGFSTKEFGGAHSAVLKEFHGLKKFTTKDFMTGSYGGAKSFWMGDFKFSAASASTKGKHVILNLDKPFDTKAAQVKTAREAEKGYKVREYATNQFAVRGTSQDRFDKEGPKALEGQTAVGWTGKMQTMTIDQVRDLLNKNK